MTEPIYDEEFEDKEPHRAFAYCDHCGFAIDSAKEAVVITGTRDVIHSDCWAEYAEEHMFDLAVSLEKLLGYDRGD